MPCPYCGEDRADMTDEHVLPKALGGALFPTNPLKLPVCGRCNNTAGRYVDGPFVRSWLVHNARAAAAGEAIDFTARATVPLVFMGKDGAWPRRDPQCDFWLGPTGDHVYHFHAPYPNEPVMVGRPPHLAPARVDPGVVFVNVVATNPLWHQVILDSIADAFSGASIHYLNASVNGAAPPWPPVPDNLKELLTWTQSQREAERGVRFGFDTRCGERFMAKLALGFGSLFLDPAFIASDEARSLRTYLWTTDPDRRAAMQLRGMHLFQAGNDQFADVLNWRGCHAFMLGEFAGALGLAVNIYGRFPMVLRLTDNRALWEGRVGRGVENGLLWIVAPGLRQIAGPVGLGELIAERNGEPTEGPLAALRRKLDALPARPPHHL